MKATLVFDLPKDAEAFRAANNAAGLDFAAGEFYEYLKALEKYSDTTYPVSQDIRQEFFELFKKFLHDD